MMTAVGLGIASRVTPHVNGVTLTYTDEIADACAVILKIFW